MFKRIITLILAVAMVLSLGAMAGCKDDSGSQTGNASGSIAGSSQEEEEYFLDMPEELKGTTVKFATWIDHAATDTAICLEGFQETTGMKYELVQVNQGDYIVKMTALIAAEQSPDVVVENGDFPRTLNLLQPLSEEANGLNPTDPFWDQQISELYHVGKNYYLVNGARATWGSAGALTYYNNTILEENGIKTPQDYVDENNWNIDSMWTLMEQIEAACDFTKPGTAIMLDPWLNIYGGNQYKWNLETDKFENALNSDNTRKAIDYLIKARGEGLLMIGANHDDNIAKGNGALQICGSYGLRKSPGWFYTMDPDDLGFAVLPKLNASDANYPYTGQARGYGICKGARNAKGAAYFLRYFLNQDHYDIDQIFKNDTCKEMFFHLRDNVDYSNTSFSIGVGRVTDPSYNELTIVYDLIYGTYAQINTNLAKVSNVADAAAASANRLINDVIKAQ